MNLDEARVEKLTVGLLNVLKEHYMAGPIHPERVFEALNALAVTTAVTLHGTDAEALEFFMTALRMQMDGFERTVKTN